MNQNTLYTVQQRSEDISTMKRLVCISLLVPHKKNQS